ncbi:hypothetical protein M408DRAFT_331964 [Serendipita vermifera MAFF 305830]|uniref:Fungal-type protein kinase domain-containing protein n=1 Tax=Serendipita vermifera MAFF 305830 TaxID=933852 RepID=A0A0C2X3V8_SERVB|nr:hypothetical protein M408DRAFT_331964 [Serendipita vermifera MAFF 305830]
MNSNTCCCLEPHEGHGTNVDLLSAMSTLSFNNSANDADGASDAQVSSAQSQLLPHSRSNDSQCASSVSSTHIRPENVAQEKGKKRIAHEIESLTEEICVHCFCSNYIPGVVGLDLRPMKLPLLQPPSFSLTYATPDKATRKAWPKASSSKERDYYPPLESILNEVIDSYNIAFPEKKREVAFIVYDKAMAPGDQISLKPDLLLGVKEPDVPPILPWKYPILTLEVKGDFVDALNQVGTYAREMLEARPGRQVCWAFFFDHKKSGFRVILFTADRVHFTQPLNIMTKSGYKDMVKIIVSLLEQPDLLILGEDPSRDSKHKLLPDPDHTTLEIKDVLFTRKSVTGRRTRILSVIVKGKHPTFSAFISDQEGTLKRDPPAPMSAGVEPGEPMPNQNQNASISSSSPAQPSTRKLRSQSGHFTSGDQQATPGPLYGTMSSKPSIASVILGNDYSYQRLERNQGETMISVLGTNLQINDHLVVKESWPLKDRCDVEWEAFTSCTNQFGLPFVVYKVIGCHPMPVSCTSEKRIPVQIAMKEKGEQLIDASSPRALLIAVIHSVIGHWNLFRAGWLHRDVSVGNILILKTPVSKTAPAGIHADFEHQTQCSGILVDGDAMINVRVERRPSGYRLCTLPFLSLRLVGTWAREKNSFDQYFDDLESFVWVVLWALLHIAKEKGNATKQDQRWINQLTANDLGILLTGKKSLCFDFQQPAEVDDTSLSPPFLELLSKWFGMFRGKIPPGTEARTLLSDEVSTEFYRCFLQVALDTVDQLPDNWK